MNHREEVLEVSKIQIGKGGFGEWLESRTRKRMGRRCWKVRVSDTLLVEDGTVFVNRKVSSKLNRNLIWDGWKVARRSWKQGKVAGCLG